MAFKINFNGQSLGEEIANAVSHGIGALLAIAGTVVLIVAACVYGSAISVVSSALYGAFAILVYLFSTIYHSLTNTKAKKVFQIFDHCSIFLMILGSYIPISLCLIKGSLGWTLFGIMVGLSVIGIVFNSIDIKKWHKLSMVLYVIMGWSLIVMFKEVMIKVPPKSLILLVGGGVAYTLGIVFFVLDRKYMHYIWHLFVLLGSVLQYFFILFYVIPA